MQEIDTWPGFGARTPVPSMAQERKWEELAQRRRIGRTVPNKGKEARPELDGWWGWWKDEEKKRDYLSPGAGSAWYHGGGLCCQPEKVRSKKQYQGCCPTVKPKLIWGLGDHSGWPEGFGQVRGRPGLWDWAEEPWNPGHRRAWRRPLPPRPCWMKFLLSQGTVWERISDPLTICPASRKWVPGLAWELDPRAGFLQLPGGKRGWEKAQLQCTNTQQQRESFAFPPEEWQPICNPLLPKQDALTSLLTPRMALLLSKSWQTFRTSLFSVSQLLGRSASSSDGALQLQVQFILGGNCPPFRVNKVESRAEQLHFHFPV